MIPQPRKNVALIKPYIPGKPIEEVRRELNIKVKIIKLASNENPLGTSKLVIKALRKAVKEIFRYPDDGCYALGKKLAEYVGVNPNQLIFGNGSVEIIDFIIKSYVAPGDHVVLAEKSFIMFKIAATTADAKMTEVPLKNYTHNLEAMAEAITPLTKVVYIANPNNPTGTMVAHDELVSFIKRVPESCVIVLDEAYSEYISRSDFPKSIELLKQYSNLIILRTFSKIYGLAGLRIGYGIAHSDLIASIGKARLPFNVGLLSQIGAMAALDDINYVEQSRKVNDAGKKFLYQQFDKMKMPYVPSEGNFIMIDPKIDSTEVFTRLQKRGVIVRPVKNYGMPTELRVTIGSERQNKKFVSSLKKVLKEVARQK
jgi:histidinol-phosphate aminotransferase